MFTLKKIWDALNHAGRPWQISLAIALALIVGFTPFVSLHNILIILVVLILNIHLGIFILFSGVFSAIAYIFDPLFHKIGLAILTNDSLNSLFTIFYNNPILNLTQFNNTLMMGSLLISLILFIPVLFIINKLIVKYREVLAIRLQNISLLNKITYFQEESKKVKTFRVTGLIVIAIVILPIFIFSKFYLDGLLKDQFEIQISKNTKKDVSIKSLSLSFLSSSIEIKDILISDKENQKENVAIDRLDIDVDILNLILKKLIIENISIENINFPNHVKKAQKKQEQVQQNISNDKFDINDIKQLAKVDTPSIKDLQKGKFNDYYEVFKKYYKKIKPIFNNGSKQEDKKIAHQRAKGVYIDFKDNSNLPQILVKKGNFSINFEDIIYKGILKDFTTDQNKYKKPFILNIISSNEKFKELKVDISILEMEKISKDSFDINIKGFKPDSYTDKKFSISNTLIDGKISLDIINGVNILSLGKLNIISTDISLKNSNKYISKLNDFLKGTRGINITFEIKGNIDKPNMKFKSNLQKILKEKTKEFISSQKDVVKKQIEDKAKKKVQEKIEQKLGDKLKGVFKF